MSTKHQLHWTTPTGLAVPTADSTFEAGGVLVTWSPEDDEFTVAVTPRHGGEATVFQAVNGFWSPDYPDWVWRLSNLSYFVATGRSMPAPPPGFTLVRYEAAGGCSVRASDRPVSGFRNSAHIGGMKQSSTNGRGAAA